MNTNHIINRMNDLEIGIQEVKAIYNESMRELLEKQYQLKNQLSKGVSLVEIDSDLLIERALLQGDSDLIYLSNEFENMVLE